MRGGTVVKGGGIRTILVLVAAVAGQGAIAQAAEAQSLSAGGVAGTVLDETGAPIFDVTVSVIPSQGGTPRVTETNRDGQFVFDQLPPGIYDVLGERLGYRPQRVMGVMVRAGTRQLVDVRLIPAAPPVDRVDLVAYDGGTSSAAAAGLSMGGSLEQLLGMPRNRRSVVEAARFSSFVGPDLSGRGLPGSHTGFLVDGTTLAGALHPALGNGTARGAPMRLAGYDFYEVMVDEADVEVAGFAGPMLSFHGRQGGRETRFEGWADFTAGSLRTSEHFEPADAGGSAIRAGGIVAGPIVADTAHFILGAEVIRDDTPLPPLLDAEASPAAAAVLDRLGDGLSSFGDPFLAQTQIVSGFAGLDWQIAEAHRATGRIDVARVQAAEPALFGGGAVTTSSGTDVLMMASLTSRIGDMNSLEFRLGLDRTQREYTAAEEPTAIPFTTIANGSLGFGIPPALNGTFRTSRLSLSETFFARTTTHQFKFGAGAWLDTHERDQQELAAGVFRFSDAAALAARQGTFERVERAMPFGSFSTQQFFAFFQDRWSLSPAFELLYGVRVEYEVLPLDDIVEDVEWLALTGVSNREAPEDPPVKFSPRLGFRYDLGGTGDVFLRGAGGIFYETVDPDVVAEALAETGDSRWLFQSGALGTWPGGPTGGNGYLANTLSILGSGFRAPRSERGTLGVGFVLGAGVAADVSGGFSRTSGLPRRTDLNRTPGRAASDQDGRPVFGDLVKDGGLLYAMPGSNRLFPDYERVYVIEADGEARHWSLSAGIERRSAGGPGLFARYTFTSAEDDWMAAGLGTRASALSPFPGDFEWEEATSDFATPHRLVAGIDLPLPSIPVRIGGFYRYQSGRPFTPGFPPGVDINADGVYGNDPAFVRSGDVGSVGSEWSTCLSDQVGRFADRNACHEPDLHRLDLRLALDFETGTGARIGVFIDALDLLEEDLALRDHALYRVDPAASLEVNPGAGTVMVPLVVNENFGEPIVRLSSGRTLRLGVDVRF